MVVVEICKACVSCVQVYCFSLYMTQRNVVNTEMRADSSRVKISIPGRGGSSAIKS